MQKLDESPPLQLYRRLRRPPQPNLEGDRDVEYSWVVANMPDAPGRALDFGCGKSWIGFLAARKGFDVTAVDLQNVEIFFEHPSFRFLQGDICDLKLEEEYFDLIINCSSIEHVGLAGRYGIREMQPDKDISVMKLLRRHLKPSGKMLLTIPVGKDSVFVPLHRVYGPQRLPQLLEGWLVEKKEYWIKDAKNCWVMGEEPSALNQEPVAHCYGLGLFVLSKRSEEVDVA